MNNDQQTPQDENLPTFDPATGFISGLIKVHSKMQYDALPSGALYEAANGTRGVKP